MRRPSLVAPPCLQAEPERPMQLVVQVVTAVHFGQLTLSLPVEHWCDPPEHDKIRWNGQRKHLARYSDHMHAKFGGSNLPAGRARATKATGGASGYSSSLWPIHTYFAGRATPAPIALKTSFLDFPHRDETKKHHSDRIPRGRFDTTILGGLFQAAQKAGLTKVVQLRWKRVFSSFPIGAKRKNTLGIEFHEVGFILPFWVGFSKQGKKPGWRTWSNCVQNAFFRLSPSGRNEKTPLGSNSTRSVSYHHFEWAFPSSAKSRVDERRPIAFKTRFFDCPHRGETKKHPWDRIPRGRFHTTILSGLFQAGQKAGLTNVVQLRSKRVFFTFPIGAKR